MKIKKSSDNKEVTEKKHSIGTIIGHTLSIIGVVLLALIIFLYALMAVVIHGPSESAKELFVNTCMETSFAKKFPPLYLSDEEINKIISKNQVITPEDSTDQDAIDFDQKNEEQPELELIEVSGDTYKGKALLIKDPSRIFLGTPPAFGEEEKGEYLLNMLSNTNATAGINAGGFADENGVGSGGIPLGYVIKDSKLMYGNANTKQTIIGFDKDNKLCVGTMTANEALNRGVRDAVTFGPVLIVNGEPSVISGSGGGLNPRTAIGQRKDGTVIMLVIDGRQPHSLGATYKDLVDLMVELDAVNAANLDGGSSSMLYLNGKLENVCSSLYGPRRLATAFLVK